jgi:hypothetical protein
LAQPSPPPPAAYGAPLFAPPQSVAPDFASRPAAAAALVSETAPPPEPLDEASALGESVLRALDSDAPVAALELAGAAPVGVSDDVDDDKAEAHFVGTRVVAAFARSPVKRLAPAPPAPPAPLSGSVASRQSPAAGTAAAAAAAAASGPRSRSTDDMPDGLSDSSGKQETLADSETNTSVYESSSAPFSAPDSPFFDAARSPCQISPSATPALRPLLAASPRPLPPLPPGLVPGLDERDKYAELSAEVWRLHRRMQPTQQDRAVRRDLICRLQHVLTSVWRGAVLVTFGSSVTGFGTVESDMDLDIVWPYSTQSPCRPDQILRKLARALMRNGYPQIQMILGARVPIIKVTDTLTGVRCDVAHLNRHSDCTSLLLNDYSRCDARVAPLVMAIKHWSRRRSLGDTLKGGLNSFGLTLMAIQFLQTLQPPVVPNFQNSDSRKRFMTDAASPVEGKRAALTRDAPTGNDDRSVGALLVGFFRCFAKGGYFAPATMAVSVRCGQFTQRADAAVALLCSPRDKAAPLCIEDPFQPSNNVARNLQAEYVNLLFDEMAKAKAQLERGDFAAFWAPT